MNSKNFTYGIIILLIVFIIGASFKLFVEPRFETSITQDNSDVRKEVSINDKKINALYIGNDILDIELTYGNIYEKYIEITNDNNEDLVYSIKIDNCSLSNNEIYYDVFIQYDDKGYIPAVKDKILTSDVSLVYNLVIEKNKTNKIKIVFKAKHENEVTKINGRLMVNENISSLELFNITLKNVTKALEDKISGLNGISTQGYYILNINSLSFENDASLKGYVLIDANDISIIRYIYTIYNDKYMVKNNDSNNLNIVNVDNEYINTLDNNQICYQYDTRISCSTNIPKSSNDQKSIFYSKSKELIKTFNNEFNKNNDKVYVYDIKEDLSNSYSLEGYILKNNNDLFLYIHNDLFMISGYNYGKLGDYNIKSTTIRTYVESAFDISAFNKNTVCTFSGFSECYDKNDNRIGE